MNDLRERFAPLREETPTDEDIAAVLSARAGPRRRRPRRLLLGVATATATAAVAIAALPGVDERPAAPASAAGMLRAAAAVAADQPGPPAFSGYRYTEVLEHWDWGPRGGAVDQRVENWVDTSWKGRSVAHEGKVLAGKPPDFWVKAAEREFVYGDGPLLDLDIAALPTEPRALLAALDKNNRSINWAPGLPTPEQARYDITRSVLLLLGTANTTPSLRAALWGVLALLPGLQPVPDARDPLGREGEAVTFSLRPGEQAKPERFKVIFDPKTSELLSWSLDADGWGTPDQTRTFIRAAHVRQIGDRPR